MPVMIHIAINGTCRSTVVYPIRPIKVNNVLFGMHQVCKEEGRSEAVGKPALLATLLSDGLDMA